MKKQAPTFYTSLVQEYKACEPKKEQVEIDYNSIDFLDADLRNINTKQQKDDKRVVVFIAKDVKTKKTVLLYKPIAKYSDTGTRAVNKLVNELLELGYRLNKAKTIATTILDLHNPNEDTTKIKLKTKLLN